MSVTWITKKLIKLIAIIAGAILVLLIGFHFWFIYHAESLIENMVASQSGGKVNLQVRKFKFNWFSRNMELRDADFFSTDTATAAASYRFAVKRMHIRVKAILPIIFDKKIMMDSLSLIDPHISVTRLRIAARNNTADSSLSVPQEMGRIYHSIQDALQVLQVDGFVIRNGTFSLLDKTVVKAPPMQVSRIHLRLENLTVDTSDQGLEKKILFSDNVVVETADQDIRFPDGRHRLIFRDFRINVKEKVAEFDSCRIMATRGDSSGTAFSIFFDKLRMTNIDFDTLYHHEIIKADSVYCFSPTFRLDVELPQNKTESKPPRLDELIQQLTGDMQLAFVVVENGSFDINTTRDGVPSSFTSHNNNFNLQGLQINSQAARPVTVDGFSMAIRNYENFLKDSAYAIRFDSVHLKDNRISLSNFNYQEFTTGKTNVLAVPRFELYGLSWDDLVFHRRLTADRATLYHPQIFFDTRSIHNKKEDNIFTTLAGIGRMVQLTRLDVEQGQVDLLLHDNARLKLQGARFSVKGNELTASTHTSSLLKAVDNIHFTSGTYQHRDTKAALLDVDYNSESGAMRAASLQLKNNTLDMLAKNVRISAWHAGNTTSPVAIEGLKWDNAIISWAAGENTGKAAGPGIMLTHLQGKNTSLKARQKNTLIAAELSHLSASQLSLLPGQVPHISQLQAGGHSLHISGENLQVQAAAFSFADDQPSTLEQVSYAAVKNKDTLLITVPLVSFRATAGSLLQDEPYLESIELSHPSVKSVSSRLTKNETGTGVTPKNRSFRLGKISLLQPSLRITRLDGKDTSTIVWEGSDTDNFFTAQQITFRNRDLLNVSATNVDLVASRFRYKGMNKKSFEAGKGRIAASLQDIGWKENDLGQGEWQAMLRQLTATNFHIDSTGRQKATWIIQSGTLTDLHIRSSLLLNLRELAKENKGFHLQHLSGHYKDSNHLFHWQNVAYSKASRTISLDSFSYRPAADKETFIKNSRYQNDYLHIQSGKINMGPFDLDRFIKDSVIHIGHIKINGFHLTDFRDTRLPRDPTIIRPLLVNTVKKINTPVQIDSTALAGGEVSYAELNQKTGQTGTIHVNRLSGLLLNIKNLDASPADSLEIRAEAYLQDSLFTRLYVKESYTSPLGGFIMQVQAGPADLRIFNPVLGPLASAHVESGMVDTMYMDVTGREVFAYGNMTILYRNLKVKLLDNNLERKGRLKTKLATFLINTVLKNQNKGRSGIVFTERRRDRSAINYLVKTVMSGITSNAGLKKSKKQARKYRKEINTMMRAGQN